MTWGTVAVLVAALATGALVRVAVGGPSPGVRMAASIGLFVLGAAGSLVLSRTQAYAVRRRLERRLVSLGPDYVITDWSDGRPAAEAPDYVLVAPAGILAVVLSRGSGRPRRGARLRREVDRARRACEWVRGVLGERLPAGVPVRAVLAVAAAAPAPEPGGVAGGEGPADRGAGKVEVLDPEGVEALARGLAEPVSLDGRERIRLTRALRSAGGGPGR